jgi:hypothetical protein
MCYCNALGVHFLYTDVPQIFHFNILMVEDILMATRGLFHWLSDSHR